MLRHTIRIVLLLGIAGIMTAPAVAAAKSAGDAANRMAAANTRILLFNVPPAGSYDIRHNGAAAGSASAGPAGSVSFSASANPGDRIEFILTGIDPVRPTAPSGFVAVGNTEGCVSLSWTTPAPAEYVTNYALLWGTVPGVYSDSLQIGRLDVVQSGSKSLTSRCGFPSGTFHFALRAHNSFDLWSASSAPSTTTISNENTQGPPPPTNVAVTEDPVGCAKVTWRASGDPTVVGYRVYVGERPRSQATYADSTDVGSASQGSICGLAPGTYYLAVRSRTGAGLLSAYSKEVSVSIIGPDVTPPVVSQQSPGSGATDVPRNTSVFFVVTDARSGVAAGSITVKVDGQLCAVTATPTPGGNGYNVQCRPPAELPATADVLVEVSASDQADPANTVNAAWSFRTGANSVNDIDPPVIVASSPAPGAGGVAPDAAIEVIISDGGLGVDFGAVVMTVDGSEVLYQVQGTPASARVTYRPAVPFAPRRVIRVRVEACDRAATPNCALPLAYEFTIGDVAIASAPGSIVPDGFWVDDPARPLEVRNLPQSWRVRVFDAAGTTVRRFDNTREPGYTWTWDFRNDSGQRVAPALYLVRVIDGAGSVQSTGRFLVQPE